MIHNNVLAHTDAILAARQALGLSHDQHPVALYLSLLHVESLGSVELADEDCCIGPLQISTPYLADARSYASKRYPGLELPTDKEALRRDAYTSVIVTMLYMARYKSLHGFDPYLCAGLHKGGVGSMSRVATLVAKGMPIKTAIAKVTREFVYREGHKRAGQQVVPRLYLYVYGYLSPTDGKRETRFAQVWPAYSAWCAERETDDVKASA